MKKDIRVAHSPDSDDAFMFYALATRKFDSGDLNYVHLLNDIETLNRKALEGEYEVSAVSFHAYAYLADKYALLSLDCHLIHPIALKIHKLICRSSEQTLLSLN